MHLPRIHHEVLAQHWQRTIRTCCHQIIFVPLEIRGIRQHGQAGCASRSEEHTSELQSLMRISYAVFCLNKKKHKKTHHCHHVLNDTHVRHLILLKTNSEKKL